MRKRKLFLHVGAAKTGSSALQSFLDEHRNWLGEHGILYPEGPGKPDPITKMSGGNGDWLHGCLERDAYWPEFTDQLATSGTIGDVLISSEVLAYTPPERIAVLREYLSARGFEMHPLFMVRNPDEWFLSAYQQNVKVTAYFRSYHEFCRELLELRGPRWPWGLEFTICNFESVLGEGCMWIGSYEAGKSDIVRYFVRHALDITGPLPPFENAQVNRSLTQLELEIMRSANRNWFARGLEQDAVLDQRGVSPRSGRMTNQLIASRLAIGRKERYVEPMPLDVVERLRPAVERINRRLHGGFIDFTITEGVQSLDAAQLEEAHMFAFNIVRQEELQECHEQLADQLRLAERRQFSIVAEGRELAEQVELLATEIRQMQESRSWRITAPLRAISSAIRAKPGQRPT